jgi:glycosyltransferase involved in cell wall biosynthesis
MQRDQGPVSVANGTPLVTVVCTAFNHKPFIERALDSFIAQRTDFPIEIMVHDDASTDGTTELIEEYARRYPELIVPFIQPVNLYSLGDRPWPHCFQRARGKYIALCEGDDFWTEPLKLQKQVDIMEADPLCAGSFHHSSVVDETGHEIRSQWRSEMPDLIRLEDIVSPQAVFHTSSFVFRNYSFLGVPPDFQTKVSVGDQVVFALVAGQGYLRKADGVMSAYRKHSGGITTTAIHHGTRFHIERMRLWMYLDRHFPGRIRDATSRVCGWHWNKIMEHTSGRERLSALRELFRDVPMWFMVRPCYALYLLRSALPR